MDRQEMFKLCKEAIDSGNAVESYDFYYSVIKLLNDQTAVKKSFPLKCCMNCTGIRPYIQTEELFGDDQVVAISLVIGCENEKQCKMIYGMLSEEMKDGDGG
ncbi:MAG: hypothetical protein IKF39_00080 [Oscillospiraceae bacterium]|nr:hypothetical protein [Oscillospiraceae bacterium]